MTGESSSIERLLMGYHPDVLYLLPPCLDEINHMALSTGAWPELISGFYLWPIQRSVCYYSNCMGYFWQGWWVWIMIEVQFSHILHMSIEHINFVAITGTTIIEPYLISCRDLITWQGTRMISPAMAVWQHTPFALAPVPTIDHQTLKWDLLLVISKVWCYDFTFIFIDLCLNSIFWLILMFMCLCLTVISAELLNRYDV